MKDLVVSPKALESIARRGTDEVSLLNLLTDRGINLQVTHEVLQAAAGNHRDHVSLVRILLERSDKAMVSEGQPVPEL